MYYPLIMKKSSVEKMIPILSASFFALVDLPDPGSPLMRMRVFLGLSASINLLLTYNNQIL